MALRPSSSSGHVSFGSDAALDDLPAWTALFLVHVPLSWPAFGVLLDKRADGAGRRVVQFTESGNPGNLIVEVFRATAASSFFGGPTPGPIAPSEWNWIAVTYDSSASPAIRFYHATIGNSLAEFTSWSTSNDGSGALKSEGSANLLLANHKGLTVSPTGTDFEVLGYWASVLSEAQLQAQIDDYETPANSPLIYAVLGAAGADATDLSGNDRDGTVTSMTQVDGPPEEADSDFNVPFEDTLVRVGAFVGTRSPEDVFPFDELLVVTVNGAAPAAGSGAGAASPDFQRDRRLRRVDPVGRRR